ncbi:MAG: radical SAM protein [Firmicutes bacterium]|nr:radical SAM protein [Bacillota bacterium]
MPTIHPWPRGQALNRSPEGRHFGFDYSLNPYRGCAHACRYCYARESHQYLDLNLAEDFEQQLFVKHHLLEGLARELARVPVDAKIAIGTVTDPYQPLEGRYRLTRQALALFCESGHRVTVTTKSPLIERDLDLLAPMGQRRQLAVHISVTSLDRALLRRLEPGTSPPQRRLTTVRRLKAAGVPVAVFVAPLIAGLTDREESLDALFAAIREAGADWVMVAPLRLSPALRPYFLENLAALDAEARHTLAAAYGADQMPCAAYRAAFHERVSRLLVRHRLTCQAPDLVPYRRSEQLAFPFC